MSCFPTACSRAFLGFLAVLVLSGCESRTVTALDVAGLEVAPKTESLSPGQTLKLSATAFDREGRPLDRIVEWASNDEAVAVVDPEGLVEARSPGKARVIARSGGAEDFAEITVSQPALIAIDHGRLEFQAAEGDGLSGSRQLSITNSGGGTLEGLTISPHYERGSGWLEASLTATRSPTTATVRASAEGLVAGEYRAVLRISASNAENSPFEVEALLRVDEPPPSILLSSSVVGFVWEERGPNPPVQTLSVRNGGRGDLTGLALSIRYAEGQLGGWLGAELDRTSAPAELTLRVSPGSLTVGQYEGFVAISGTGTETVELRVRLTVAEPPPEIEIDVEALEFEIGSDGALPPSRTVRIENGGGGRLERLSTSVSYESGASGWLNAELAGSLAPTELEIDVVRSDLPPGRHEAEVIIESPDAANSPRSVSIGLEVAEPLPLVRVAAVSYRRSGLLGVHLNVTLLLEDADGHPVPDAQVTFTLANTENDSRWSRSGVSRHDGTITVLFGNHPPGCYEVRVTAVSATGYVWDGETPMNGYCHRWGIGWMPGGFSPGSEHPGSDLVRTMQSTYESKAG